MADSGGSGGIGLLGVIIGALIVVGLGVLFFQGGLGGPQKIDVNVKPPAVTGSK